LGYSQVEVYLDKGKYQGKVVYLSNPNYTQAEEKSEGGKVQAGKPRHDINNPDKSKRNEPILGMQIVFDFVRKGNQWRGGKVYDPESGKTYKGKMWLNSNGTLGLRGFVGIAAFGRSTTWTPLEAVEPSEPESNPLPEPVITDSNQEPVSQEKI